MKTRTKVGLAIIGVSVSSLIVSALNSKVTNDDKLKEDVLRVWNNVKEDICLGLRLKEMPKIQFDGDDVKDCVMYVRNTITTTRRSMFSSVVTDSSTDYIIHVNLASLGRTIKEFKQYVPFSKGLTDMVISHLLYHESRHIWQGEGIFYIGRQHNNVDFDSVYKGHGEIPEEIDANAFATNMAKTKKEKALAIFLTKTQENAGKMFKESAKEELKAVYNEFNPLLGSVLGFFNYI